METKIIKDDRNTTETFEVVSKDVEVLSDYSVDAFVQKHIGELSGLNYDLSSSNIVSINTIPSPYSAVNLCSLSDSVGRLSNCIKIMVENTISLGWDLVVKQQYISDIDLRDDIKKEKELVINFFDNPSMSIDFDVAMEQVKRDQHTTGNGYLEVTKSLRGVPVGWKHIPSHTILMTRTGLYVQSRNSKRRYFKPYGFKNAVDRNTGMIYDVGDMKAGLANIELSTEVIHFRTYSTRSSYYGIPVWISILENVYGNILAERRSLFVLENDSTPKFLIVTHGEKLDDDSRKGLKALFNRDLKGIENAGRIAILSLIQGKIAGISSSGRKIEVITLDGNNITDAGYQEYINNNNESIREIFGIASAFFTSEGANRSNSSSLRDITIQSVFEPEARKTSRIINKTILRDLGIKYIDLKFRVPSSQSEMDNSIINTRYASSGALSINDVRKRIGEDPMEFDFASLPPSFALALINKGLMDSPIKK